MTILKLKDPHGSVVGPTQGVEWCKPVYYPFGLKYGFEPIPGASLQYVVVDDTTIWDTSIGRVSLKQFSELKATRKDHPNNEEAYRQAKGAVTINRKAWDIRPANESIIGATARRLETTLGECVENIEYIDILRTSKVKSQNTIKVCGLRHDRNGDVFSVIGNELWQLEEVDMVIHPMDLVESSEIIKWSKKLIKELAFNYEKLFLVRQPTKDIDKAFSDAIREESSIEDLVGRTDGSEVAAARFIDSLAC